MLGLDDWIAGFSDGATVLMVAIVAVLLGLRHATDPDHLAAVTTLMASGKAATKRAAATLGCSWGLGHAAALFAFGFPIVLFKAYLPGDVQRAAETAVGGVIVALAIWLLVRWRRGVFHLHAHEHGERHHLHVHAHSLGRRHAHERQAKSRSPLQAFGIGIVHGVGGSAGVGVLLLASIHDRLIATGALALFAFCTALSMALVTTGFGATLSRATVSRWFPTIAPALGLGSLAFGVWYALGALEVAPYSF